MRTFIDEHGNARPGDVAPIAAELGLTRPDFDVALWVVKALGWVELTLTPGRRSIRWRPSQLGAATAIKARRLLFDADALAPIEMLRWTDRWQAKTTDSLGVAWELGAAVRAGGADRQPTWQIVRRLVTDLYRDRHPSLIEDLSRVAARRLDRATAVEVVDATPSGLVVMVEQEARGKPFHYLKIGRGVPVFDCPEAFVGRDLRESSDPAFSAASVPSYEIAATTDEPVIEDIEGPILLADGRIRNVAYRRVLIRVAGGGTGPVIVMETSAWLRPLLPVTA